MWKHYLDWDKNVFEPNAKKARIVQKIYDVVTTRASIYIYIYAAGLWKDTYPANLSPSFFWRVCFAWEKRNIICKHKKLSTSSTAHPQNLGQFQETLCFLLFFIPHSDWWGPGDLQFGGLHACESPQIQEIELQLGWSFLQTLCGYHQGLGWTVAGINGMVGSTVFVQVSSCYAVDARFEDYHCQNPHFFIFRWCDHIILIVEIHCFYVFFFYHDHSLLPGSSKSWNWICFWSTLLKYAVMKTSNGQNLNHFQN